MRKIIFNKDEYTSIESITDYNIIGIEFDNGVCLLLLKMNGEVFPLSKNSLMSTGDVITSVSKKAYLMEAQKRANIVDAFDFNRSEEAFNWLNK